MLIKNALACRTAPVGPKAKPPVPQVESMLPSVLKRAIQNAVTPPCVQKFATTIFWSAVMTDRLGVSEFPRAAWWW